MVGPGDSSQGNNVYEHVMPDTKIKSTRLITNPSLSYLVTTSPPCYWCPGDWTAWCSRATRWRAPSPRCSGRTSSRASRPSLPTLRGPSQTSRGWWGLSSCLRHCSRRKLPTSWRNPGRYPSYFPLIFAYLAKRYLCTYPSSSYLL